MVARVRVALVVGALMVGGCSSTPEPGESRESVEQMRDLV